MDTNNIFEKNIEEYQTESFRCFSDYNNILEEEALKMPKPFSILAVLMIFLALAFSSYMIITGYLGIDSGFYSSDTDNLVVLGLNSRPASPEYTDETGKYTTAGIAKEVGPSIVEIITYPEITKKRISGTGSGIILSKDGYIVTNAHVISSGKAVDVSLGDNSLYEATTIGYDSKTDIAVIKIEPAGTELPVAIFGNSDEAVQGERVVAIGNPGGLTGSVSEGCISAVNRMIRADSTSHEMNCIQTDAAISPGNSGGALVNMYGQVIGITSSKYVDVINASYEGLGFAITINDAKPIIEELIANGYIAGRFKVGITFVGLDKELAEAEKLCPGLLISDISKDCDIANTELKPEDIIFEVEGKPVTDYDSFMESLGEKGANDTVHAKVARFDEDGNKNVFEIEFKLMPDTSGDY